MDEHIKMVIKTFEQYNSDHFIIINSGLREFLIYFTKSIKDIPGNIGILIINKSVITFWFCSKGFTN